MATLVGLVHAGTEPVACVAAALRDQTPHDERSRIASAAVRAGPAETVVAVAEHLAGTRDRSPAAAEAYGRAAQALDRTDPGRALVLYDLAVAAGQPAEALAARHIAAAVGAGQAERAIALAAAVPADAPDATRAAAARRSRDGVGPPGPAGPGCAVLPRSR